MLFSLKRCGLRSQSRIVKYTRLSRKGRGLTMEYAIGTTGPDEDFAVNCRSVTKTYGTGDTRVMALRGIDLEVRRGELLMLVGPSGCGKTTLISIIAAILEQDSGDCDVLGRDLKNMEQKERTRLSRSVDRLRVSIFQPAAGVQR